MQHVVIGIPLPPSIKENLSKLSGLCNAEWIDPEHLYLSLIDLGYREGSAILDIIDALKEVHFSPFSIILKGVECTPLSHTTKALSIAVATPTLSSKLKNLITAELREKRIPLEPKPFHPHVTLAALSPGNETKLSLFLYENQSTQIQEFTASSFALFSIQTTQKHTLCDTLAQFPLLS